MIIICTSVLTFIWGGLPNKGRYRCVGPDIRYFRGSCEVNFAQAFSNSVKCVIFDKRVKKVIYLLKNFNFGTLKVMKTCLVIRF